MIKPRFNPSVTASVREVASHFAQAKGYETYAEAAKELNSANGQELMDTWVNANLVGTPEMILEKLQYRRELIGEKP